MKCREVRLIEIRNFKDKTVNPAEDLTVLTGRNGTGKTNILEAVSVASLGKSFRTGRDEELIRLGQREGTIIVDYEVRNVTHRLKIKLSKEKGKKITLNDTAIKKKEMMGLFRTVLFTPDEMQLIKGGPQGRRRFIDLEISQASPRYYEEILRYLQAVRQRNASFKEALFRGIKPEIDIWDMQIAKGAAYIVKKRRETLRKMNRLLASMENFLTEGKETLEIEYKKSGGEENKTDEEWYLKELAKRREEDGRFCHTSVGPHRDDLLFKMNGLDLSAYGSQGQQRTAVLAMKLGELEFIKEETGEYPVLLLDDVGSELDEKRRNSLFEYIKNKNIQTIMTATDPFRGNFGKEIKIEETETEHEERS